MSILILDDMAYTRYRIRDLLESNRYEVFATSNSIEFFNILNDKTDTIQLIIMEVGLNREDGFEILRRIKSNENKIPVMVITALNTRKAFIKSVKQGVEEYILKPFDNQMLLLKVQNLIKRYENKEKIDIITDKDNFDNKLPSNFNEYLVKQIKKASLENYPVSVVISSLLKQEGSTEKIEVKERFFVLTEALFINMKKMFKEDELFVKYGVFSFLAILPHNSDSDCIGVINKLQEEFEILKERDSKLNSYEFQSFHVTYPDDGITAPLLLESLVKGMREHIK